MHTQEIQDNIREYFRNGERSIQKVIPQEDFSLIVHFDNGETKKYNMANHLTGVFSILKDFHKFKTAFIDEYGNIAWNKDPSVDSTTCWSNRIDLCKDAVYFDSIPLSE